jgi:hypothetical protein
MRPDSDDFRVKLDAARRWEIAMARWVRARGWFVLPTDEFSGRGDTKAPKLLAPPGQRDFVLPDLQCFRFDGAVRAQWLECKWKHEASEFRKGGYRTTGFSLRLAKQYEEVERLSRQRVVLVFLHEKEREVRAAALADLSRAWSHDYAGTNMPGRKPMRFWRYDQIPMVGTLSLVRFYLPPLVAGSTSAPSTEEIGF